MENRRLSENKNSIMQAWDDTIDYIRELEEKVEELEVEIREMNNREE